MPRTTPYQTISSSRRMANDLGRRNGPITNRRSLTNGRLAAITANRMTSQAAAEKLMRNEARRSGRERANDRLRAQRHQPTRQDAEQQHGRAVHRQQRADVELGLKRMRI